ncbi:MAG: 5-oxoprolinase subunit PxpB [Sulfobacillus sp.]|nr:5-oxoprolinase subunit PxpB [Sulfobacillus sp.]
MPTFLTAGDSAILAEFGHEISPEVNDLVIAWSIALARHPFPGFMGYVPAYTSVLVEFDPGVVDSDSVRHYLEGLPVSAVRPRSRVWRIPVLYGGEWGPDLISVAETTGLTPEEVTAIHAGTRYRIYAIGFSPGFPLCGVVPAPIRVPRRDSPRVRVPAGSVALAGQQTGIYPLASPGGWNLIGRTPAKLFDWQKSGLTRYQPGDYLEFYAIDLETYERLNGTGHWPEAGDRHG